MTMTGLPSEAGNFRGQREISDVDRELFTNKLNQIYATGDLELEEYLKLLDSLYAVRTQRELELFARNLPVSAQTAVPAVADQAPSARPGQLSEIRGLPSLRGSSAELRFWLTVASGLAAIVVVIVVILAIVL